MGAAPDGKASRLHRDIERVRFPRRPPSLRTDDWNWLSVLTLNQEYVGSNPTRSSTKSGLVIIVHSTQTKGLL